MKLKMNALIAALWVIGAFGAIQPIPAPEVQAAEPYHLGVALGLTQTGAEYSKEAVEAIEMAVNEINAAGGMLGRHPVKLYIRDTRTDAAMAVQVAQKMIRENAVRCIIGTYSSAAAQSIKPICRENRVLHIAAISNSEDITKIDFSPYTFSVVPNTYMMAKGLIKGVAALAREKGWKTYATIASDYAWGRSSQSIQVQLMREIAPDIELIAEYWPKLGETQFNTFVVAIMARKPDFLLGTIGGADNAYWMRDAREYRLFKQIEYPGGLISVSELIDQALSIRRGQYGRCRAPFFAHMDVATMTDFVRKYSDKHDRYPTDWAVMSYDAVYALKQGIEKAGSIDSEAVKAALRGSAIDTTRGRLFFREIDNQLSCSAYFGRVADDSRYPIPTFKDLMELKGPQIWRPEPEIVAARAQQPQ
jgi:branched-chain amino acid transport system substrate-binding protein